MGARGLEMRLPPEVREWLEAELIRGGFSGYSGITTELNAKLEAAGAETASRSAVHRFGQNIEDRISALKRTTEIARTLATEVGDDEGAMNDALVRLVQDKLFNVVVDMEIDPESVSITQLGRVVADLGRASVQQKKYQLETRAKVEAKLAALEAESKGSAGRLDAETLRRVREEIYGVI
jgi:hypothetical protein